MSKKKICFISLGNLYLCPYIIKYISLLECDYDVIYWDRHGIDEKIGADRTFVFRDRMDEGSSQLAKLVGYLKFRKYTINRIKENNYDGIVLLQTSIGILLQNFLKKEFSHKYIVDIRDYTMEKNKLFFAIEKQLIENSAYAVISSMGYTKFLPEFDYTLVHNDIEIDDTIIQKFKEKERGNNKLVISYIGLIRFHEQNKKIILKFKNDSRFLLKFIGKDANALRSFCEENEIKNVELIDRFPPGKTLDYYHETDIICNLYGNNTPLLDYALSNKLYYAAKLRIPILVCPGTYMEEVSNKYGFGITFNIDDSTSCDDLYYHYKTVNWDELNYGCEKFVSDINKDNKVFNKKIIEFIDN